MSYLCHSCWDQAFILAKFSQFRKLNQLRVHLPVHPFHNMKGKQKKRSMKSSWHFFTIKTHVSIKSAQIQHYIVDLLPATVKGRVTKQHRSR